MDEFDDGFETDDGFALAPEDAREQGLVREAAEALMPLDIGDRAAFATPKVDLGAIRGRLQPPGADLQIGTDVDRLGDDLAKLREHQADLKLRALLDKADRALRAGRVKDAWAHVQAALEIAPTDVPALLLGARCQHAAGSLETALGLLATAREHARDAGEVTLVLRLRDICEFALLDEICAHVGELLERNAPLAVAYVERKVALHPEFLGLRYIHGAVLFRAGRLVEARDMVESMLAGGETGGIDAFTELHQAILFELCAPQVELARQSLRAGRLKEAIGQLTACGDALRAIPRYEWVWSYTHDRYAKSAMLPFVGWRRARQADAKPLDATRLQEVLSWLLSEELGAALTAFRTSDFDDVGACCVRAEAIDPRCGTVAYLHAMAETRAANAALRQVDLSTLAVAERRFAYAALLAEGIAADPELADTGAKLAARIAADREEVARLIRLVSCLTRFSDLNKRYAQRRSITREELYRIKGQLRSIRASAVACKQEHGSDSPVQRTLDGLIGAIDRTAQHLPG